MGKNRVEEYVKTIVDAATKDEHHLDNPENQIDSLALIVDYLLKNNRDNKYEELIGFYTHVGRSLKKLIQLQQLNKQDNG